MPRGRQETTIHPRTGLIALTDAAECTIMEAEAKKAGTDIPANAARLGTARRGSMRGDSGPHGLATRRDPGTHAEIRIQNAAH